VWSGCEGEGALAEERWLERGIRAVRREADDVVVTVGSGEHVLEVA